MRTNLAADFYSARPRFPNESHTASRADVLTMNQMIAKFSEQDVAHDYCFFACCWPAGQPKESAPITLMHNSIADQIVILTMIEQRHANHACIFDRATHDFVILNAMTIISDG